MDKRIEALIYKTDAVQNLARQLEYELESEINKICDEYIIFIGNTQHNELIVTFLKDNVQKMYPVYNLFELYDNLKRKITFEDIPKYPGE